MEYVFKLIECYKCKHVFMWLEGNDGNSYNCYEIKDTGVLCGRAVCPACGVPMVILPGEHSSVSIDDPRIKGIGMRPI